MDMTDPVSRRRTKLARSGRGAVGRVWSLMVFAQVAVVIGMVVVARLTRMWLLAAWYQLVFLVLLTALLTATRHRRLGVVAPVIGWMWLAGTHGSKTQDPR